MLNTPPTKIRLIQKNEIPLCAKIMAESEPWITLGKSYEACLKSLMHRDIRISVVLMDKNLVGFFTMNPRGMASSPYIQSIAVKKNFRHMGIGHQMISFAEKLVRKKSRNIFICVSDFNKEAIQFYEDMGFTRVGEFKDYLKRGNSELLYRKIIH
jgi:ribosomal protein S18 acetylase RimI-like enzyme